MKKDGKWDVHISAATQKQNPTISSFKFTGSYVRYGLGLT